jgi:hypothetical protein
VLEAFHILESRIWNGKSPATRPNAIERECRALHHAPFVKRRHSSLNEALGFAEIEADAHAESGQPEDSIQNMLNTYPYGECAASCPKEAVAQLFGLPART